MSSQWMGTTLVIPGNHAATALATMGIMLFTLIVSVAHFSYKLPRRSNFWLRFCICFTVILTVLAQSFGSYFFGGHTESNPFTAMFFGSTAILLAFVLVLYVLYDASIWSVIFCATAGYTMQNFASSLAELSASILRASGIDVSSPVVYLSNTLICFAAVLLFNWLTIVRQLDRERLTNMESKLSLLMLPAVAVTVIGFDVTIKSIESLGIDLLHIAMLRFFHIVVCIATLWISYEILYHARVDEERRAAERFALEHERQYNISRDTIEAINIKCHDIRHQIRSLANGNTQVDEGVLKDLAKEVSIYDSAVHTGNDALDTILTEKNLICENENITLTCIADGEALSFMAAADLYALFGNALDNAIEAARELEDPALRTISLVVREALGTISIHVENYCKGSPSFKNGLPQTTKRDTFNHGIGTRSMKQIVERYGGTIIFETGDNTFSLNAMIPLQ